MHINFKFYAVQSTFLILVTLLAFSSLTNASFVNLDDHDYILKYEAIRNLNSENVKQIFCHPVGDMYIPLVYLSYSIDYFINQFDPVVFHLHNLFLHILNILLLLWLIRILTNNSIFAFVVVCFFAIHPTHVESVAWLSERKDLLYSFYYLLTIICYHFYCSSNNIKLYMAAIFLFVMSCLSKPMAITLPAILILYDIYFGKNLSFKILQNKIPFFLISFLFAVVALHMMDTQAFNGMTVGYNTFDKAIMWLYAIFLYFFKTFIPLQLSVFYIYPHKLAHVLPINYIISAFVILGVICFVFFHKLSTPLAKFSLLFFLLP